MGYHRGMTDSAKLRMTQIVLHWAWDPIGVRGIAGAVDEYDMYAQKVLDLLEADAPAEQIASYLGSVVRDRMELPMRRDRDEDVSVLLKQLFAVINERAVDR